MTVFDLILSSWWSDYIKWTTWIPIPPISISTTTCPVCLYNPNRDHLKVVKKDLNKFYYVTKKKSKPRRVYRIPISTSNNPTQHVTMDEEWSKEADTKSFSICRPLFCLQILNDFWSGLHHFFPKKYLKCFFWPLHHYFRKKHLDYFFWPLLDRRQCCGLLVKSHRPPPVSPRHVKVTPNQNTTKDRFLDRITRTNVASFI